MPLERDEPRADSAKMRFHMRHLERIKARRCLAVMQHLAMTCGVAYASGLFTQNIGRVLLAVMASQGAQMSMLTYKALQPRSQQKAGDFDPPQSMHHFSDEKFYENFRFHKLDFLRILRNLKWLKADGVTPKKIKVGPKGHRQNMKADWLLMVVMRRLARPCAVVDVCEICGGGRTEVTKAINYALNVLYGRYGKDLSDVSRFAPLFPAMAAQLKAMGCPFDSCIGFLDGNNQHTSRPGGQGCVWPNLHQESLYSGKHKRHGLLWQALVLVNGMVFSFNPEPNFPHPNRILNSHS